ncbi:MAG: tyrosine-type recombinase/integrase [Pseudomonadota bacterium]
MSRSYKNIKPKKHFVYSVDDLMKLFGVCRNTISNWVKEGLKPSDASHPYVFRGSEVKRFRDARHLRSAKPLRIGQFGCFVCKERVFPKTSTVSRVQMKNGTIGLWARCPNCGGCVTKIANKADCDRIMQCVVTNTNLDSLDEESGSTEVGLGTVSRPESPDFYLLNDRILHEWLNYGGRWSLKTIEAKLAAIRQFEEFCGGQAFSELSRNDVTRYRDHLKTRVEARDNECLSVSTVRHLASHVMSFSDWLIEQPEFARLDRSLPKQLILPKRFDAAPLGMAERPIPTVDEAERAINLMSGETIKGRRDRAMVAIAFLGALRADTVTSLLLKHLQIGDRIIGQDAVGSRTKNGKSLRIKFFPLPPVFLDVLEKWMEELIELGFRQEDAIFPDEKYLSKTVIGADSDRIKVMASTHAISSAFKLASRLVEKEFSPHSAKHCIGQLGLDRCKTPLQTKAWSQNMGHEGEDITQRYYQNIPESGVHEILEEVRDNISGADTPEGMELMLQYHEHKLTRGTPEFMAAKQLVHERYRNDL